MKKNMIPALALGVLLFSLPSFGKMLYVSNTVGNDEYDGLAAAYDGVHGPKFKIQSAIDAAEDGDTVIVAPGTYGDEQGAASSSVAGQTVRIWIDKAITLKSSGDRTDTFIVGKRGANDDGTGAGAVTGIQISKSVATSADNTVEIEGFTLRDCFSDVASSGSVGGVIGWQGGIKPVMSQGTGPWVVACTISNCVYNVSGAISHVNAVRTFVKNNKSSQVGVNAHYCNLVFCVLAGAQGQAGLIGSKDQYAINCTIVDSTHNPCSSSCKMNFFNTVFTASSSVSVWATLVSNCVMGTTPTCTDNSGVSNFFGESYRYNQIAAPLFNDYRPIIKHSKLCSTASLCDGGDPKWLDLVPEEYRNLDFEGKEFGATEKGTIHIGAVQTSMMPAGMFSLDVTKMADASQTTYTYVNGMQGALATKAGNYATRTFFDDKGWPQCYEITAQLPEGNHLWGFFAGSNSKDDIRFPTKDGKILFVPIKGDALEISAIGAAKVFYVNCETGDDIENDGLSAENPFETIQKAIDEAENYHTLIYVAPGLYNKGAAEMSAGTLPKSRIAIPKSTHRVRIVALGSAEETIIAGEPDTTSDVSLVDSLGNGPNAVRCIRFHSGTVGCVQGFTIADGHTDSSAHTSTVSWRGGGAFMSETKNCWLLDCIVSNNCSAASGAAMYGGTAVRCRFADNRAKISGGFAFYSPNNDTRLVGCLLLADEGQEQNMLRKEDTCAVHCSSFASANANIFPSGEHSYLFNNVILNNSDIGGNASSLCASGNIMDGTKYLDKGINVNGAAYINGSAYYVDALNGDLRISTGSEAIGTGTAWTDLASGKRLDVGVAWTNYYSLLQHDFDGSGLVFTDGNPTAGAYQKAAKYLVLVPVNRPSDVTVSTVMTNMLDFGDSITVSAVDGKRKVMGLEVNGRFIDSTSYTVQSTDFGMTTVKVLANTNWYVDAENGSDSGKGWTEDVAFRTLEESVKHTDLGDVVVALPGTYSEGSMIQSSLTIVNDGDDTVPVLYSRVVVPEKVSLVSRDGAESTVIKGEFADTSTGHGDGAMRCVYLHKGARLSGFTVTGGATRSNFKTHANDNNSGAGIFCAENPTTSPVTQVTDCIVSNNIAKAGGGGAYRGARVVRCRFFDNESENEGGAVANCCIYECVFDRNYGYCGVNRPYDARGCTFGATTKRNRNPNSNNAYALLNDPDSAVWNVYNCLFLGGKKCMVKHAHNCIMPSEGFIYSDKSGSQNHSDLIIAEITVDSNYAPMYDSAAANAANMDYVKDWELEGDAYGNPRRSNGGMDIGAVETDWRPNYAAILGSRTSVKEASWDVVATSAPGVLIPDGGTMNVDLDVGVVPSRGAGVVRFAVGEGAVLTILRSGKEPLTYSEGIGEYRFRDMKELEQFAFSVAGGNAVLLGIDRDVSFSIVIR